jgi:asparagine synthetase B (glutamine-hydrolysing)
MPGLAGCIDLLPGRPLAPEIAPALTRGLLHEPYYTVKNIPAPPNAAAVAIEQGADERLSGAAVREGQASAGFYGEFYGAPFDSAERGDDVAKLLLDLYLQHGENLPRVLDGSFVAFVADFRTGTALLFNDHYASRPLFYGRFQDRLYFSPELKGVAGMPGAEPAVDPHAFANFLLCGHLLGEQTFYRDIRPLLPGSLLKIAGDVVVRTTHTLYAPCGDTGDRGDDYYVEALSALLLKAAAKQTRGIDRAFVPLSGGVDSRAILGCLSRVSKEKLHSVSWGVEEGGPESDAGTGRKVAALLQTDHHFIRRETERFTADIGEMVYRIDGLNDDAAYHHNEMSAIRRVRDEFGGRYVLRGEECFGPRPEARSDLEVLSASGARRLADYPGVQRLLNPALRRDAVGRSAETIERLLRECPSRDFTDRRDQFYFAIRIFHYHTRSAYYKRSIADVRNPWLDKEVLAFMQAVPVRYRFDKHLYKKTVRTMFPELFTIPIARRHSLENWAEVIRTNAAVQEFLRLHLLEERNAYHDLIDREEVARLLAAACAGATQPSLQSRAIRFGKETMRKRAPRLYARLKPALIGKAPAAEVPASDLLFRMLISKLWFDRFRSAKS